MLSKKIRASKTYLDPLEYRRIIRVTVIIHLADVENEYLVVVFLFTASEDSPCLL